MGSVILKPLQEKNTYRKKLLVWILTASVIPLLICAILLVSVFFSLTEQTLYSQSKNSSEKISNEIQSTAEEYRNASLLLRDSETIQNAMLDRSIDNYITDLYIEVLLTSKDIKNYAGIGIYDSGGMLKFTTDDNVQTMLPVYDGIIQKSRNLPYQFVSHISEDGSIQTATDIYATSGAKIGYIVGTISAQTLLSIVERNKTAENHITLIDEHFTVLLSTLPQNDDLLHFENSIQNSKQIPEEFHNTILLTKLESLTGIFVVVHQSAVLTQTYTLMLISVAFLCTITCITICIIASVKISRDFSAPIKNTLTAIEKVKQGDLNTRIDINRDDELGMIAQEFNAMTNELSELISGKIEQQKSLNDAQIRSLQAQMNPHFLYNTLDTIKWLAHINGSSEISSLVNSLARILRQSINNEQYVSVKQELDLVRDYIEIQKIRFSDKFTYTIDVSADLSDYIIPKLIIQPIVENSILHAFEETDNGTISITAYKNDNKLYIEVTDNGCGIPDDLLQKLNDTELKILPGHLGLYNVNLMIKLNYGQEYGLCFKSKLHKFTTVTLILPTKKEE